MRIQHAHSRPSEFLTSDKRLPHGQPATFRYAIATKGWSLLRSSLVVALAGGAALAIAAPDPVNPDTLDRIIVSGRKVDETIGQSTATVSVIDDEDMQKILARDLRDLLRYEPGLTVASDANRFGLGDIRIRGLGGNRVAIEVDGVAISDAFAIGSFASAGRNAVDVDTLKQVEILRGPASSLYGSDALGGIVSFVTKDPSDYLGSADNRYGRFRLGFSSIDTGQDVGGTAVFRKGSWSALVNLNSRSGSESESKGLVDTLDSTRTAPNPRDYNDDSLLAKLVYVPREGDRLRFTVDGRIARSDTDVISGRRTQFFGPTRIETQDLTAKDRVDRRRFSLDYDLGNPLGFVDQASIQIYAQDSTSKQETFESRTTFRSSGASPAERYRVFNFDQELRGVELTGRTDFRIGSSEHRLIYGLDYERTDTRQLRDGFQRDPVSGSVTNFVLPDVFPVRDFPNSETRELGLYVQDSVSFMEGRLVVTPALRYDRYELEPKLDSIFIEDNPGVPTSDLSETAVSPKLGVSWNLNPNWSVHGQYSEGFRAPPFNDVNLGFTNFTFGYTAIPNPDLRSETSQGFEVGLRGRGDWGFVALTAYRNEYEDFIESLIATGFDPESGLLVFQSQNLDDVEIEGFEARAAFELGQMHSALDGFRVNLAYAHSRGDVVSQGVPLNSVDPDTMTLGLGWVDSSGRFELDLVATGAQRKSRVNDSDPELFQAPGYGVVDLLASWRVNEHLKVNAGVFNIADKRYSTWADVQGRSASSSVLDRYTRAGRNVSISINLEL